MKVPRVTRDLALRLATAKLPHWLPRDHVEPQVFAVCRRFGRRIALTLVVGFVLFRGTYMSHPAARRLLYLPHRINEMRSSRRKMIPRQTESFVKEWSKAMPAVTQWDN